jgi:hypothetical protein
MCADLSNADLNVIRKARGFNVRETASRTSFAVFTQRHQVRWQYSSAFHYWKALFNSSPLIARCSAAQQKFRFALKISGNPFHPT